MRLTNTQSGFGLISIIFHWIFAISIIGLLASGIYMVTLTYYHPWYYPIPHYHKLIGIGCIVLFVARTCWHFACRQPDIDSQNQIEIFSAKLAHKAMLVLSGLILLTGYLIISIDTSSVQWLMFELPPLVLLDNQTDIAGFWHQYLGYGLLGLIILHIGATLKHQLFDKKSILCKILKPE